MKAAIFIASGLGNALVLIPLIKRIKAKGGQLTGIFTSSFQCEELFSDSDLFDEIVVLKGKADFVRLGTRRLRYFDEVYLDFFAATRKNYVLAQSIGKKLIANHIPEKLPSVLKKGLELHQPEPGIHETTQNLRLVDPQITDEQIKEADLRLKLEIPVDFSDPTFEANRETLTGDYAVIQVTGGNNKTPYKNWPLAHWKVFLKKLSQEFPEQKWVLLGDRNEVEIGQEIMALDLPGFSNLIGATSVRQAVDVVRASQFYLGIDSGLMHLAVCFGKPTFSIWGGSDFNLFGYEKINPERHRVIYSPTSCRPCNSWIAPNTSRVKAPLDCPDFICLQQLSPQSVLDSFRQFAENLLLFDR